MAKIFCQVHEITQKFFSTEISNITFIAPSLSPPPYRVHILKVSTKSCLSVKMWHP